MRIAICDDNLSVVNEIRDLLCEYSANKSVDFDIECFDDGNALLSSDSSFHIAVLDVEMPGVDGITLGEKLREQNQQIVLIYLTAHSQYLDSALNLNAARFFQKPIDRQRFFSGIDNALQRIDSTSINVYVRDNNSQIRIPADSIIYVEIDHRKTKLVTTDNTYLTNHNLDYYKDKLVSSLFTMPHKSYIVNMNYVTEYRHNEIVLDDKYKVPVSRTRQAAFRETFIRFMEVR